jgi:hypothetical protein
MDQDLETSERSASATETTNCLDNGAPLTRGQLERNGWMIFSLLRVPAPQTPWRLHSIRNTVRFSPQTPFNPPPQVCNNVAKRMDEMSKSAKPWFRLAAAAPAETPTGRATRFEHQREEGESAAEPDRDPALEARRQIRAALARGGRERLLSEFLKELRRVLQEQATVLELVQSNPAWALPLLNRQYYAIRSTAEVLHLHNLAQVSSRAEVLSNLLDTGIVALAPPHANILTQTHGLLLELVAHVAKRGSDDGCYPITKTALWMYSTLDPALNEYEPGPAKTRSHLQ